MKELEHEFLRGEGLAESEVEGVSEVKDQDEHECGMILLHVLCHVHLCVCGSEDIRSYAFMKIL